MNSKVFKTLHQTRQFFDRKRGRSSSTKLDSRNFFRKIRIFVQTNCRFPQQQIHILAKEACRTRDRCKIAIATNFCTKRDVNIKSVHPKRIYINHVSVPSKFKALLKKRMPSILFFLLSSVVLALVSALLFGPSYKEIFLALMLWSLPLFLH